MGLFGIGKRKEVEVIESIDTRLSVLSEIKKIGFLDYLESGGIKISSMSTDIDSEKIKFMLSEEVSRIAIIETGSGRFLTNIARKNIKDLTDLCTEEGKLATIFYSSSNFKDNFKSNKSKNILYVKYINTSTVLNTLKGYNENYIFGGANDSKEDEVDRDKFKGTKLTKTQIDNEFKLEIDDNVAGYGFRDSTDESLRSFKAKY